MEAVTTKERENFMKNKKISKVVLSVLTSMSMLSSYSATIFAETPSQETGVAHEHDLIELERKSDLITMVGLIIMVVHGKKQEQVHLEKVMEIIMESYHLILIMQQFIK